MGDQADFRVLLPEDMEPVGVKMQGKPVGIEVASVGQSRYAVFSTAMEGLSEAMIECRKLAGE